MIQNFVVALALLLSPAAEAGTCLPLDQVIANILEKNEGAVARPLSEPEAKRFVDRIRTGPGDEVVWFESEQFPVVYVIVGLNGCARVSGEFTPEAFGRLIAE